VVSVGESSSVARLKGDFKWTAPQQAIRKLIEQASITREMRVEMIARRLNLDETRAESTLRTVERLIECKERSTVTPRLPKAATIGTAHVEAVSAALEHADQLVRRLPSELADQYRKALGEDSLPKAQDCVQKVLVKLRDYCPEPGSGPRHEWGNPLVRHGYRYIRRAVAHAILDEYVRPIRRRAARLYQVPQAQAPDSANSLQSYLRQRESHLARLWAFFDERCDRTSAETLSALAETARVLGWGADLVDQSIFFHAYLHNKQLSNCLDRAWIKAHLAAELKTLNYNAVDQRKYRLKSLWLEALEDFRREINSGAA
jgi:hypothetical protein